MADMSQSWSLEDQMSMTQTKCIKIGCLSFTDHALWRWLQSSCSLLINKSNRGRESVEQ